MATGPTIMTRQELLPLGRMGSPSPAFFPRGIAPSWVAADLAIHGHTLENRMVSLRAIFFDVRIFHGGVVHRGVGKCGKDRTWRKVCPRTRFPNVHYSLCFHNSGQVIRYYKLKGGFRSALPLFRFVVVAIISSIHLSCGGPVRKKMKANQQQGWAIRF
jgi:hypothetical protein